MTGSQTTERKARLLARCTRGLEWLAAAEIKGRLHAEVIGVHHREIRFELPVLDAAVLSLDTADDVFLTCGTIQGIDHTRASLHLLSAGANRLDFAAALSQLQTVRGVARPDLFDVVASFLGRRNYNRFEIEGAVGTAVASQLGAVQQGPLDRASSDVSWRVHLRNSEAYVGLRIPPRPLHRRHYKATSEAGTLHPPIASAMALLAGIRDSAALLDPFCGFGTVPIEAARWDAEQKLCACDIDPRALEIAEGNAERGRTDVQFVLGDAAELPFAYRAFDRIASNLPWGRAVRQKGVLALDTGPFWREASRVLHSEGRAVTLCEAALPTDSHLKEAGLCLVYRQKLRVSGRWSVLSVVVPESSSSPEVVDDFGRFGPELRQSFDSYGRLCEPDDPEGGTLRPIHRP